MTFARPVRALPATLLAFTFLIASTRSASAALPKVPEGFEIRLVAAVPAVEFPCQVATAPDGALFIAEDPMDQVGPANKPIDRILLFRDGKEPVVFADKLNAVFGMLWHEGALYVMNMPNLTVLRDTNGDGKADQRKELFTNLGVPAGEPNMFNDHIVSGIQIGIDGYLYVSVGDKGVPKVTGVDGRTAQIFGGGTLRCRLDGTGLEVFSSGTRNHLEPNLDAKDNLFTYDNTDDGLGWWTRVTHHVDGGFYGYPWDYHDRTDRMLNRMAEYGGGSPCGGLVYKEDVWPEKYRGRGFWAEWAKRTVRAIAFKPDGASFKVDDDLDFVKPGDVADFRPLDLALSYDGRTMYIADWGMGGWGNKTEKLGRVYAVTYKGEVKTEPRGKDSDPVAAQIRSLSHASFNERCRAQWALVKKGRLALGDVTSALADPKTDAVAKRHLVWVVDGIAGRTPEATVPLVKALTDASGDVRAQAARALGERAVKAGAEPLAALVHDTDPTVRLQALIALGRIGEPSSVTAIVPLVGDSDPYLAFSARRALKRIGDWKRAASGLSSSDAKVRLGLLLAMEMVHQIEAARTLAAFAEDSSRDPSERARALFLLAQGHRKPIPWNGKWWGTQPAKTKSPVKNGDWEGTPLVLTAVRQSLSDPASAVRLEAAKAEREVSDPSALPVLRERFVKDQDAPVRVEIARTLGALGDKQALPALIAAMKDQSTPVTVQDAALESVETIGSDVALKALLDLVQSSGLREERQPRVVAALGRFKSGDAVGALLTALKSPAPAVRAAAAEALGKAGTAKQAATPLRDRVKDTSLDVRNAAIAALGELKAHDAIPALVEAANAADTHFEAALALAKMPDVRALSVYLPGLGDPSPSVRRTSAEAISTIRDEAAPVLEQFYLRREMPVTDFPELRKIFTRVHPLQNWHVLGKFPINTAAPFSLTAPIDLKAKYPGFGDNPLTWKSVRAKAQAKGEVDLNKSMGGGDDVAVFAYADVDSPAERKAEFAVGSDDTLTVWINGEKVYDFQDNRGFTAEQSRFDALLLKGTNRIVLKCGNRSGGWSFSVALAYPSDYAFLKGPLLGTFNPETFRKFAMTKKGRAEHGRALFSDLKGLACVKCHAVGGQGGIVGPELASVGAKYPKNELIESVLYPSAKISSGYESAVLAVSDGRVLTGIVKGETADAVELEDVEGHRIRIEKADIEERKQSNVSLMPNRLVEWLTPQDFTDLIAYLETLKDVKPAGK